MNISTNIKQQIMSQISSILASKKSCHRKELVQSVLQNFGVDEAKLSSPNPSSREAMLKSYATTAINELVSRGDIVVENGEYHLLRDMEIVVELSKCEELIFKMLTRKPCTKKEIFKNLERTLGTDRTATKRDDQKVHSLAGQVLYRLQEEDRVVRDGDVYKLIVAPPTKECKYFSTEGEFQSAFLQRLCEMGGSFFEHFTAGLLEKYFVMIGREVLSCAVTGGSSDGGVDIVIETMDGLGFVEQTMVQTKCRANIHTTEKEIREFYGAVNARKGTRGIFATTATFHPGAINLLHSLYNCVGIDGDKIFELALQTGYGIQKTKDGYSFDERIFSR